MKPEKLFGKRKDGGTATQEISLNQEDSDRLSETEKRKTAKKTGLAAVDGPVADVNRGLPDSAFRVGILASGRGSNLQALIDAVAAGQLQARLAVVVSDQPDAQALVRAQRAGIPAVVIPRGDYPSREDFEAALAAALAEYKVDLVVLAGFMRLLSPFFVNRFQGRLINIHPSLLPAFPGLDAQGQALRYGVRFSGCTVHFVDTGTDTGPVIAQAVVPVEPDDTVDDLAARILAEEHRLLPRVVNWIARGMVRLEGRHVYISQED